MKFTVGADPELFVSSKGSIVSAYDMIPGTKDKPHPVKLGAVQVDGMALEFNIDPAGSRTAFVRNITTVMDELKAMIPKGHQFAIEPSTHFPRELLDSLPEAATELGCEPDYNAYTENVNPTPDAATTLRTAAGHIHVGFTDGTELPGHFDICCDLTKQFDASLGLYSLLKDSNTERRKLYGRAGAFRPKPYGMEYRVLSNFWLKDRATMKEVYDITMQALNDFAAGDFYYNRRSSMHGYTPKYFINSGCDFTRKGLTDSSSYSEFKKMVKRHGIKVLEDLVK